ncbi:MAG: hypothetical protein PHO32_09375 [Candidatus Cloacimonetes bacterium]|nr:hypothetical protein [Candidatus Cloacimonadota bacterium]
MDELITNKPPQKILFIDEPFMESDTPRSIRSRFIWGVLSSNYDADLLLLKSSAYLEKPVAPHFGYDKLYSLSLGTTNNIYPDSYHVLASNQADRFASILDSKRYELIVFAGLTCMPLWRIAKKTLPSCLLVLDVDNYFLPQVETNWKANVSYANLPNLWNYTRQKIWDNLLLKADTHCFFASPSHASEMQQTFKLKGENILYFPLPVEFPPLDVEQEAGTSNYILFWGNPENAANIEVGRNISAQIYPRISKKLVEKNIELVLCGHTTLAEICGGRIKYAPYSEMLPPEMPVTIEESHEAAETMETLPAAEIPMVPELLSKALMVLLPLEDTDTENRIPISATAGKAVVCSPESVASMHFPEKTIVIGADIDAIAQKITRLIQYPRELHAAAVNLQKYCAEAYDISTIQTRILDTIKLWIESNDTK